MAARINFLHQQPKENLLLKGASLYSADKTLSGYVLIFDDVTPIIQSQRNAAWSEVAQRLAHEIKNPLTPIQLSAERLQRKLHGQLDEASDKILKKSTDTIVQQVAAMKSMVNDFSDFARPPQSKPQSLNIGQLVDDIANLYKGQIKRLNINIETELPCLFADPIRLRQVLINLIKNAQEATADLDNGEINISVTHLKENHCIQICIADNGVGVDNSKIDHIFEPYVTSKDKGTGLGLAIVKKIIEEHGGCIAIKAVEPQGAKLYYQVACSKHLKLNAFNFAETPYEQTHILVIDDEPDIRSLICDILEDEDYQVSMAESAAAAQQAPHECRHDLILLDIWMPDTDGVALLKEWANTGELSCPVIMMSGHGTVETAVEATRLGAYDFLEKPLSIAKLLLTVERALEAEKLKQENIDLKQFSSTIQEPLGNSVQVQQLLEQARRLGQHDTRVLLTGEPGTGKETLARYIHENEPTKTRPFY